ncbi:MAG TPA: TRAP transporter small permease [Usitatibacter sp.]|nr:TRAP transporter small permease [Usitatibacter sp.]
MSWLDRVEEGLIAFLLAAMTVLTFAQVVARYGFNYSFSWALELTTVLFAWLIFLGIPYGVRVGSHIGVDALVKMFGPMGARITGAGAALACIAYSVILFAGSWQYVAKMHSVGIEMEDLPIQQWIPRSILVISFALLTFRFVQVFWRIVTGRVAHVQLGDEAAEALRMQAELGEQERNGKGE